MVFLQKQFEISQTQDQDENFPKKLAESFWLPRNWRKKIDKYFFSEGQCYFFLFSVLMLTRLSTKAVEPMT